MEHNSDCFPLHVHPIALMGSVKVVASSPKVPILVDDTSSRSYLILRPKDKSDPDPKLATVLLHIWPLMILVTVANLVLLVCTAGLIGAYIFPALLLCGGINYRTLLFFCGALKGKEELKDNAEQNPEDGSNDDQNEHQGNSIDTKNKSFIALAALSSIWLPSVVGYQSQRIFLVSGVTSLTTKVLLLAAAVAFSASGLQPQIYSRPFLLFCFDENSTRLNEPDVWKTVTPCSIRKGNCLPNQNITHEERFMKALERLERLELNYQEEYDYTVNSIDDDLKAEIPELNDFFHNKLNNTATTLKKIKRLKEEVDKKHNSSGVGKVQQKIRICEKREIEIQLQLAVLSSLLVLVALAAYSTYRLHRIADYQVSRFQDIVLTICIYQICS